MGTNISLLYITFNETPVVPRGQFNEGAHCHPRLRHTMLYSSLDPLPRYWLPMTTRMPQHLRHLRRPYFGRHTNMSHSQTPKIGLKTSMDEPSWSNMSRAAVGDSLAAVRSRMIEMTRTEIVRAHSAFALHSTMASPRRIYGVSCEKNMNIARERRTFTSNNPLSAHSLAVDLGTALSAPVRLHTLPCCIFCRHPSTDVRMTSEARLSAMNEL